MHEEMLRRLDTLADSDNAFEVELFQIFLSELEKNLAALEEACEGGDLEKAARESHSLKGSALNVGANRFSQLCEQLEIGLKAGKDEPGLRKAMAEEYHSLAKALNARLETLLGDL